MSGSQDTNSQRQHLYWLLRGMKSQGPTHIFRSWEHAIDRGFHQLDKVATKLESDLPKHIPRPLLRGLNRSLKLLEGNFTIAFLLFFLLACSRAFYWLANPQFYIEDGQEFYLPAFLTGLHSIPRDYASYYHVIPRILSLVAAAFPLCFGPLLLELLAIGVQSGVAAFLLSHRISGQLPSKIVRFGLAFFIVGNPNSTELFANVAHSQWYLAILSLAILFSDRGRKTLSNLGDCIYLTLAGLTGPFAPILALITWRRSRVARIKWMSLVAMTLTAAITAASMIQHPRGGINSDASATRLFRLLANQILYGTTRGFHYAYHTVSPPNLNLREFGCAVFSIVVIVAGLWRAPAFMRALGWLGLYCLAASLVSQASWNLLGCPGVGERYFLYLDIVFAYGLFSLSQQARSAIIRWCFRVLLLVTLLAILQEWVYDPPFSKFDYAPQIAGYDQLRPGEVKRVMTPIDRKSPHDFWTMMIPKKD